MILRDFADAGAGAFEEAGKVAARTDAEADRISAPNSGSSVSLLVNIMALALPSWLTVSRETGRRRSWTISSGHENRLG